MFSRTYPRDRRSFKGRQVLVLLLCAGALCYFASQGLQSRYGLETRTKLLERSVALTQELSRLEAVRARLERDTTHLAPDPPDLDLLDEHARRVLGFLHPSDRRVVPKAP